MKYFLTIAASDNCGGAGMQMDLKVAEELGYWGLSAITGITVQNFERLDSIYPVDNSVLTQQIELNIKSYPIECTKIGAICSEGNVKKLSIILQKNKLKNIVLDPVFAPSKGTEFIKPQSINLFREKLLPFVNIVTPNKTELSMLAEQEIANFDNGIDISKEIVEKFGCRVFLKGGHFEDKSVREALITETDILIFEKERQNFKYSHGTGCTFSTALSCFMGEGLELKEACRKASDFVSNKYRTLNYLL